MKYIVVASILMLVAFLMCCKLGKKSEPEWYNNQYHA